MALSSEQRAALLAAVTFQLEATQASLDAARSALAILAGDAQPHPSDNPAECTHPSDRILHVGNQELCDACGLNLSR